MTSSISVDQWKSVQYFLTKLLCANLEFDLAYE